MVMKTRTCFVLATFLALLGTQSPLGADEVDPFFTEVSEEVGILHSYWNGMTGEQYLPEIMGGGGALLDYDRDGDLDLFVVQGGPLGPGEGGSSGEPTFPQPEGYDGRDRLFENQLLGPSRTGGGKLEFRDVTDQAGLTSRGYGMGAIAADFDNDGWDDIYVLNFGPNSMLRNLGDGTFEDVTTTSGTGDAAWSVAAAASDFDRDGFLDLYVVNYVDFKYFRHRRCPSETTEYDYCGPLNFPGAQDRFYRNRGDGTFEDVTAKAGLKAPESRGLAVTATDLTGDGLPDIYVANDQMANHLFVNQGGTFQDEALLAGTALNAAGRPEASMGVDAGDFDNDGDLDLFLTHLRGETNTLYLNEGDGLFRDATSTSGLGTTSIPATGFGTVWLDVDNDGWLDVASVNGAINTVNSMGKDERYPLDEPNQIFVNRPGGSLKREFVDRSAEEGRTFQRSEVSRGLASGDLDNDGDADLLVFNNNGRVRVFRNEVADDSSWIGITASGSKSLQDLKARVVLSGGRSILRHSRRDGSYASSHDPRILIGLGDDSSRQVEVELLWPSGQTEKRLLETGRYHEVAPSSPAESSAARRQ